MPEDIGIAFPFQVTDDHFPLTAERDELADAAIKQILLTELGERVMRPLFGSRLREFLFESIDPILLIAVQAETIRAILDNTNKVRLIDVTVTVENLESEYSPTKLVISVVYEWAGKQNQTDVTVSER
jgi:phage baseplate assembly protein W